MISKYEAWIADHYPDGGYGKCKEATREMVATFQELVIVRGNYYDLAWGERKHWWCRTADGKIVDPTAGQFPTKGRGTYVEWDGTKPEPTGICMECGVDCFDGNYFCSSECEVRGMAYYQGTER